MKTLDIPTTISLLADFDQELMMASLEPREAMRATLVVHKGMEIADVAAEDGVKERTVLRALVHATEARRIQ